jgi:transposase
LKKRASCGIIKKIPQEVFVMAREYRHIQKYEKEILEKINQGKTLREIAAIFGFTHKQVKKFKERYNKKQRKIEAGILINKKGRPPKDYQISEEDKAAQLRYIIARKDAKIKSLEMENELMRDFLSLTERK